MRPDPSGRFPGASKKRIFVPPQSLPSAPTPGPTETRSETTDTRAARSLRHRRIQ